MTTQALAIKRHRTAMQRYSLSKPLHLALAHHVLHRPWSLFDYGCGRGTDVRLLQKAGIAASGWDPHFQPETEIRAADCVNLGYVLNVIESPEERTATLQRAFSLASRVLIVAVRVDQALDDASEFSDGVLTKIGSFQKLYTQDEFREYIRNALDRRPHMASLGIAYVFRDDQAEADYLAQLALYRPVSFHETVRAQFSKDRTAQKYMTLAKSLGRTPLESEFKSFPRLTERYGSISRVERIAKSLLDSDMLASAQEERRVNILIFLAMLRLQGLTPPPIRSLSNEVQADVKMLWPNYKAAMQAGTEFLFELGKPGQIAEECKRTKIGKKLPDALYVHTSTESQLSPLLQLMILTARQIVGEVTYDLIKIATDGKKLSFLAYKNFDDDPHPELAYSLRLYLPKASYDLRSYIDSQNPPILHRKETFIDQLHPRYAEYAQLTKQEEELGLLSRTDIGTKKGWEALLASRNLHLSGTKIFNEDA
ncbi:DNA phosphorothioation-associated putative methyltransferase [Terriglobus sp.]|uniref:DNA phosphorothioation-associated putative methyltransferase n=1 Tax=Terriglobus sp. TaxID=1889013 RepID=UPI003AFF837C